MKRASLSFFSLFFVISSSAMYRSKDVSRQELMVAAVTTKLITQPDSTETGGTVDPISPSSRSESKPILTSSAPLLQELPIDPDEVNFDRTADLSRSQGSCRALRQGEWRGWKNYRQLKEDSNQ